MQVEIFIEGKRLDLHDDESINVQSNGQDVNDISKIQSDFSKTFNVPASDNNTNIFRYYYNADLNNGYDARVRKQSTIFIDTKVFKNGKIRLDGVELKNNEPSNYKITFFGDVLKLKDEIGKDKLVDLDWLANFNHELSDTNIKQGLTSGIDFSVDGILYPRAIVYPLISYTKQYMYNSNSSDATDTDSLVNINYNASRTNGVNYRDLKPAIKLSLIIEAIKKKYGFTFTGSFYNSERFKEVYMNLNKSSESISLNTISVDDATGSFSSDFQVIGMLYQGTVTPRPGFEDVPYKLVLYLNEQKVYEDVSFVAGTRGRDGRIESDNTEYVTRFEVISESTFAFDIYTKLIGFEKISFGIINSFDIYDNLYESQFLLVAANILNELPDFEVLGFLTSIMKTFNIIVQPDESNIFFEDLQTWYSKGEIYDITPYVDTQSVKIGRGIIYKQLNWKFEESEQILAHQYKTTNRIGYGDLELKLTDEDGNELSDVDGGELNTKVLFENPIYERLVNQDDNQLTNVMYCPYIDKELSPIGGNPFLFFAPIQNSVSLGFKGVTDYEEITSCVLPSHSQQLTANSFNLNFNAEINEYSYGVYNDTIYQRYYNDYITDIFSVKRRVFNYESILPSNLLQKLKLNDRLIIRDRRYLINNISSNLVNRKDSLTLINDIYDAPIATDKLSNSVFKLDVEVLNYEAQSGSTTYIGLTGSGVRLVDIGYGLDWITLNTTSVTENIQEISYLLEKNNTIGQRAVAIEVVDGINNPTYTINQGNAKITADNDNVTVDTTTITANYV